MSRLPILTNWKSDSYKSILVIVDRLTKIVYYKPIKVMTNTLNLAEVVMNIVIYQHEVLKSIVIDQDSLCTLTFWTLLCYFIEIE